MSDVLKVLMMGGQRTGKTSMLAGLIDSMTRGPVKDIIEVKDVTESEVASQKLIKSICLRFLPTITIIRIYFILIINISLIIINISI